MSADSLEQWVNRGHNPRTTWDTYDGRNYVPAPAKPRPAIGASAGVPLPMTAMELEAARIAQEFGDASLVLGAVSLGMSAYAAIGPGHPYMKLGLKVLSRWTGALATAAGVTAVVSECFGYKMDAMCRAKALIAAPTVMLSILEPTAAGTVFGVLTGGVMLLAPRPTL